MPQPPVPHEEKIVQMLEEGVPKAEIAEALKVARQTVYNIERRRQVAFKGVPLVHVKKDPPQELPLLPIGVRGQFEL